ncbi:MAG: hypothetical protein ABS35_44920 [Kaistia sp. SCN 65-12]|nr:MAG: hypothetical protein ABS35_44920 [Kaistia sp. SCN 65-12]
MIIRQRDIDPLIPQMRHITSACARLACQKGDIEVMPLNGDDVARWAALDEVGADAWTLSYIVTEQISEEA